MRVRTRVLGTLFYSCDPTCNCLLYYTPAAAIRCVQNKKMKEIRKDTVSGHEDLACVQSGHRSSSIQFNDLFFKMSPHTKREPRLNDDGDRLREIESHVNE